MVLIMKDGKEIRVPGAAIPTGQCRQGPLGKLDGMGWREFRSKRLSVQLESIIDARRQNGMNPLQSTDSRISNQFKAVQTIERNRDVLGYNLRKVAGAYFLAFSIPDWDKASEKGMAIVEKSNKMSDLFYRLNHLVEAANNLEIEAGRCAKLGMSDGAELMQISMRLREIAGLPETKENETSGGVMRLTNTESGNMVMQIINHFKDGADAP